MTIFTIFFCKYSIIDRTYCQQNLREEALGLKKPLQSTRQTAKDLIAEASELGVGNATHLLDDVDNVSERLNDLLAKLDDRCSQLQSASTALAQYNVCTCSRQLSEKKLLLHIFDGICSCRRKSRACPSICLPWSRSWTP